MTLYAFPEHGGHQWRVGHRLMGTWVTIDGVGEVVAGLFENETGTGWILHRAAKTWDDVGAFQAASNAQGGMGNFSVNVLKPAYQAAIDEFFSLNPLPPVTNATPPTIDGINYVLAEYYALVSPVSGQHAPQLVLSYQIPAGAVAYPGETDPGDP